LLKCSGLLVLHLPRLYFSPPTRAVVVFRTLKCTIMDSLQLQFVSHPGSMIGLKYCSQNHFLRCSDACLRVHQVDLEETTFRRSLVRLLAEAEVLDRVLAEKEFGSPYWDSYDCPGSGSSEVSLEPQPGCARWETFQRLRLVSKGVKVVVEALPEFRHMNKMRQLRQAL
jgi:hypothetical protein